MSSNENDPQKKLPSFEDWCDAKIRGREDYVVLRTNVLFYAILANLSFSRAVLIQLGKENNGMLESDSEEFKKVQTEWWFYYRKIMLLRSMLLRYFDIPAPDFKNEIMPERLYCGVLLSEEDFGKFLTKEGSGMVKMKAEGEEEYADNLRENRGKKGPIEDFKEEEEAEKACEEDANETI
jgi:hypothetical protein